MLAGIGVIIILKQIPHAFGYDANFEGDQSFIQSDGNSFSSLFEVFNHIQLGSVVITVVSLIY
jgi:MFS superfamily sulfate permease-like transporter